jgi:hypothetical protein
VGRARLRAALSRSRTPLHSSELRDRDPSHPPRLRSTDGKAGSWRRTPIRPSGPAHPAARRNRWPVAASDAPGFRRLPGSLTDRAIARAPHQTAPGFARPDKTVPAPAPCRAGLARAAQGSTATQGTGPPVAAFVTCDSRICATKPSAARDSSVSDRLSGGSSDRRASSGTAR